MEAITLAAAVYSGVQLAKPVVDSAVGMVEKLLGKPLKVASNLLADEVYCWQTVNRIRWAVKVEALLKGRNIQPQVLPKGFLMPVIEAVGNVEDDDLRSLWARLTANAIVTDSSQHPIFAEALRQLSPGDAKIFDRFVRTNSFHRFQTRTFHGQLHSSTDEAVIRLVRIGLMQFGMTASPAAITGALTLKTSTISGGQVVQIAPRDPRPAPIEITTAFVSDFGEQFFNAICEENVFYGQSGVVAVRERTKRENAERAAQRKAQRAEQSVDKSDA